MINSFVDLKDVLSSLNQGKTKIGFKSIKDVSSFEEDLLSFLKDSGDTSVKVSDYFRNDHDNIDDDLNSIINVIISNHHDIKEDEVNLHQELKDNKINNEDNSSFFERINDFINKNENVNIDTLKIKNKNKNSNKDDRDNNNEDENNKLNIITNTCCYNQNIQSINQYTLTENHNIILENSSFSQIEKNNIAPSYEGNEKCLLREELGEFSFSKLNENVFKNDETDSRNISLNLNEEIEKSLSAHNTFQSFISSWDDKPNSKGSDSHNTLAPQQKQFSEFDTVSNYQAISSQDGTKSFSMTVLTGSEYPVQIRIEGNSGVTTNIILQSDNSQVVHHLLSNKQDLISALDIAGIDTHHLRIEVAATSGADDKSEDQFHQGGGGFDSGAGFSQNHRGGENGNSFQSKSSFINDINGESNVSENIYPLEQDELYVNNLNITA